MFSLGAFSCRQLSALPSDQHAGPHCRRVIDDSIPFEDELVEVADRMDAKTKQKRWTDRTGYLIERDFMVSAYAIRKLIVSA